MIDIDTRSRDERRRKSGNFKEISEISVIDNNIDRDIDTRPREVKNAEILVIVR